MGRATSIRAFACLALATAVAACGGGAGSTTAPTSAPASPTGGAPSSGSPSATSTAAAPATPTAGTPAEPSPVRDPGSSRKDAHGIAQVWVPGGVFQMGSDPGSAVGPSWARPGFESEHPKHETAVTSGYWIDATEVTVEAFAAFREAGGYEIEGLWSPEGWAWRRGMGASTLPRPCLEQGPKEPQVCVTWYEAEAYAAWRGGRLPTEAEWEFAARGPQSRVYPWGDDFDATLANLDGATGPVAVGGYPGGASWVGALDMAGNAMEWVADWWSRTYFAEAPRDDPTGPATGSTKVEKGGWWGPANNAGAFIGRSSYRHFEDPPTYSDHHIGFRIVSDD